MRKADEGKFEECIKPLLACKNLKSNSIALNNYYLNNYDKLYAIQIDPTSSFWQPLFNQECILDYLLCKN